jgi:hypothetical protein
VARPDPDIQAALRPWWSCPTEPEPDVADSREDRRKERGPVQKSRRGVLGDSKTDAEPGRESVSVTIAESWRVARSSRPSPRDETARCNAPRWREPGRAQCR